jgi:HAD superfamily phosphoserine phosphatase-like hydrolase
MFSQVFFDFDSTLVTVEGIDELAFLLGSDEVATLTERAMNGEISVREAYDQRLAVLRLSPRHLKSLERIYRGSLVPGVRELMAILRDLGKELVVVSGGFREAIEPLAQDLGIHHVQALDLLYEDDKTRVADSPLLESKGKIAIVEKLKNGPLVFIGDGVTDFAVRSVAEKMIPYFGVAKRKFLDSCGLESYGGENLLGLLPLILDENELNHAWQRHPTWTTLACELVLRKGNLLNQAQDYLALRPYCERLSLFPGPTEPSPSAKVHELPMIGHRDLEFSSLFSEAIEKLKLFLGWEGRLLVANSSATGMMEASLTSVSPTRVLSLETGAFARRFAEIAKTTDHDVDVLKAPEGQAISVDGLRTQLEKAEYGIILITHSETSNGILNPVEELARVIREHSQALIVVDGVSSVGGIPLLVKDIDAVVFGSQKCLALPPGLGFIWLSERFEAEVNEGRSRSFYFDLKAYLKYADKGSVPFTPAVRELQALNLQISANLSKKDAYFKAQVEMAEAVWDFCRDQGLEIQARKGARSLTVTSIKFPQGHENLLESLRGKGIYLASGYGESKKTHFRIGHMGLVEPGELFRILGAIKELI